jgi:C-terminal processing protease CtpA/Prc
MVLWSQKRDGPLSVRWVLGEGDGIAQTAGIRSGDVILEIDGDNTNLLTRAEILRRLAVNFGRNVSLLVKRGEDKHSHVLPR